MDYIRIYDRNATDFEGNGKAVLEKASDVHVTREINGDYALDFKYPVRDAKMKHIQMESICRYEGQLFRIRIVSQGEVSAKAIYLDAARKHLQYVEDMIGETPYNIMVRLFQDTPIHIMTEKEVSEKGMQWVTERTDFFEASKLTPIGGLQTLTEQLEKQKAVCELYVDNYNIALVRRIGADNAGRITLRFNAKETKSELNSTTLVTRLYPYGMDDLDISTVNGGKQYIDSPYIGTYGVIEGFREFSDCEDADELLKLAQWQFSEDNLERIDVPKYNMEVKYVDVQSAYYRRHLKSLKLGDRVKIFDEQTEIETTQRIIKTDIYRLDPSKSIIEVGQPKVTFESFLGGMKEATTYYQASTNDRYQTKTSALEMMQYNKRVSINNALNNQKISLYKTGALFESPDGSCAVAIINGVLAIAAGKTNGEWDWTTVIDDNQVLVSEVFTGALYTNMCTVLSDNGKLIIKDSLITMRDDKDAVRFECGYSGGKYVFCLYNAKGEKTIYIDDDGNVVFAGILETYNKASIGKELIIGAVDESISKILLQGETNASEIINDDINKIFKISPSFGGDLQIDENGI
ncbi:MAG: phage tail spike protein, partial [Hominilimicola sp.]